MAALVARELSGWLIVGLVAVNIALPFLLRGRLIAPNGWSLPYLERMRPHYWTGLTIAGLGVVHAGLAMSAPISLNGASMAGVWVGTGGMFLAIGQAAVGMQMRTLRGEPRLRLRRTHFRVMLVLVAVGLVHVALNGVAIRSALALA